MSAVELKTNHRDLDYRSPGSFIAAVNHDAMYAHALTQALDELSEQEYTAWVKHRAFEIFTVMKERK